MTADIRDLPFADASFDAVVSRLVLHDIHSSGDRRPALGEGFRVLLSGGRFLMADMLHLKEYRCELDGLAYNTWR